MRGDRNNCMKLTMIKVGKVELNIWGIGILLCMKAAACMAS